MAKGKCKKGGHARANKSKGTKPGSPPGPEPAPEPGLTPRPAPESGRTQPSAKPQKSKKKSSLKKSRNKNPKAPEIPKPRSKMPSRRNRRSQNHFDDGDGDDDAHKLIRKFGASESRQLLENLGFHPEVTDQMPQDILDSWEPWAKTNCAKPSREDYLNGGQGFQGTSRSVSRQLTRAPMIFRTDFFLQKLSLLRSEEPLGNKLMDLLEMTDVGGQIIEFLFADGLKTVQSLALTCTRMWGTIAVQSNIWDFLVAKFRTQGHNGVFMVVTPEYTIEELIKAREGDPADASPNDFASICAEGAFLHDEIVEHFACLFAIHNAKGVAPNRAAAPRTKLQQRVRDLLPRLDSMQKLRDSSQFVTKSSLQIYEAQPGHAFLCFQRLLSQIHEQRKGIKALVFSKTPFIDRRILAIVLRGCPKVTMLGVYDCPLIHFGDVICILDLIWEINTERKRASQPLIDAFDFYPRYHDGMPYDHPTAAAHGLSWGSLDLEVVQRGFFLILLKAFMKARYMKLGLLFEKEKAFMSYLGRVPTSPLAVPTFLSALYRLMDLEPEAHDHTNRYMQALYDLLSAVRLGLQLVDNDFSSGWYIHEMGKDLYFCSSCGYETFLEFFSGTERGSRPHRRRCAACLLITWLDLEPDHLKTEIRSVITSLFPDWTGTTFNVDAPIPAKGTKFIKLTTKDFIRPVPPSIIAFPDGTFSEPRYLTPLIRDNKPHKDSLQELPTLGELVDKVTHREHWCDANEKCVNLELFRRCVTVLGPENLRGDALRSFHTNPIDEPQYLNIHCKTRIQSHTFDSAIRFVSGLKIKGY